MRFEKNEDKLSQFSKWMGTVVPRFNGFVDQEIEYYLGERG